MGEGYGGLSYWATSRGWTMIDWDTVVPGFRSRCECPRTGFEAMIRSTNQYPTQSSLRRAVNGPQYAPPAHQTFPSSKYQPCQGQRLWSKTGQARLCAVSFSVINPLAVWTRERRTQCTRVVVSCDAGIETCSGKLGASKHGDGVAMHGFESWDVPWANPRSRYDLELTRSR